MKNKSSLYVALNAFFTTQESLFSAR